MGKQVPGSMPDGSPWPKISIVTPNYNQGQYLEKTIRSVLLQGYPSLEYIIIDGESTDISTEIIKRYEPWLCYWVSEADRGQSHAINKGFEHASGDIFAWLNSDDIYLPGVLEIVAQQFSSCPEKIGALVGDGVKVNERGEAVYRPKVPELSHAAFLDWMDYGHFMQPSCFFRRIAWEKSGPLRDDLNYPLDVDLWLKMIKYYEFKKIDKLFSQALQHDSAKTTAEKERMRAETILLVMEHGGMNVAKGEILKLADDLAASNKKLKRVRNSILYRSYLMLNLWIKKIFIRKKPDAS